MNEGASHRRAGRFGEARQKGEELDALLKKTEQLAGVARLAWQLRAAGDICAAALSSVPFYRDNCGGSLEALQRFIVLGKVLGPHAPDAVVQAAWGSFQQIPLLERATIQNRMAELQNHNVRGAFEKVGELSSSGSTGRPMESPRSAASLELFQALHRRFFRWFGNDMNAKAAFIRVPQKQKVQYAESWSQGVGRGKAVSIDLFLPHWEQLKILQSERPACLITFPSNLAQLLRIAREQSLKLPSLKRVSLMAETVPDGLREECESLWKVRTFSSYSSTELGPMALSCPLQPSSYRVMNENILLEVVDERGLPVAPGQNGRVVVTSLLDPLRPLIRYVIGDYAELAKEFDGRPRLAKVLGRSRNMFQLPDGGSIWPYFKTQAIAQMKNVEQWKLTQERLGELRVEIVAISALSEAERAKIIEIVRESVPESTKIELTQVPEIARAASGKFEDFECRLPAPGASDAPGGQREASAALNQEVLS